MTEGTELAVVEGQIVAESTQPLTLFGTADPVEVLDRAAKVAKALSGVIDKQQLFKVIGTKKHVQVEGWTLLGSMLGVFPRIEWTRKLEDGWEARAVAVVASTGLVIGAGEAMCTKAEGTWRTRDDFAIRGMAQTRAISRAMRGPLGFVVQLAGYASTPADEMPEHLIDGQGAGEPVGGTSTGSPPTRTPQEIAQEARKHVKPASAAYDDTTAVCPSCGKAEALRPRGRPQFCAAKEGGCGAPPRGQPFEVISWGEFRGRQERG